jgi:hypothetical protein
MVRRTKRKRKTKYEKGGRGGGAKEKETEEGPSAVLIPSPGFLISRKCMNAAADVFFAVSLSLSLSLSLSSFFVPQHPLSLNRRRGSGSPREETRLGTTIAALISSS